MCPSGLAVHPPTYETLPEYATGGFPVKTDRTWTKEEINAAVMRGPHNYALANKAIGHFAAEVKGKVTSDRARLVLYEKIKGNTPTQMKVSPISAFPHNSKAFRSVLDLSFLLKLTPHGRIPSVNENIEKTA